MKYPVMILAMITNIVSFNRLADAVVNHHLISWWMYGLVAADLFLMCTWSYLAGRDDHKRRVSDV